MKIVLVILICIGLTIYCYGENILEFAMNPGPNKKIKYNLDLSRLKKLKKGAINKKAIEKILKNLSEVEYENIDRYFGKYLLYTYDSKIILLKIYETDTEKTALFLYSDKTCPKENILYDYKGENIQYYATYMFQHRSSLWGLYMLLDEYNTIIQIQNDNVYIEIYESTKNKDKVELQKLIDMIVDATEE